MILVASVKTPLGIFLAAASEQGVLRLGFPDENKKCFVKELENLYGKCYILEDRMSYFDNPIIERLRKELQEYFEGIRTNFSVPLDLRGTSFQKRVWSELIKIPYGRVKSYGKIAEELGNPRAARAVGVANNRNPVPILVPCHRVVGRDGSLVGYGGGLEIKKFLLELEGVKISGGRCVMEVQI